LRSAFSTFSLSDMAQVCGGTTFDVIARRKHDAAQRILSRAADLWATRGRDALALDALIAILLRIFLSRWSEYRDSPDETRPLEAWLPLVDTASQEAESFILEQPTITDALPLIHAELSFAAGQWLLGDPEQPPTAHALNAIEHTLFTHRLSHRPPAPKLPTHLCNASIDAPNTSSEAD
jgi:hypothetical protein